MSATRSPSVTALIERVRTAVRAQPASSHEPLSAEGARCVDASTSDLAALFASRAQAVGMRVTRVKDSELEGTLMTMLAAIPANANAIVSGIRDHALAERIARLLPAVKPPVSADALFDAAIGITDVDCAIAESGSLVINTNGRMRNVWITPPTHIALVRTTQILADLVDLFASRADTLDAASTTIITGPSKTADIEGVLVTGVHGPGVVEIVLIESA